jgi:hypothetical protein
VEFSGSVFAEIGCRGALEALVAVDGGVDLVIRKFKPIVRRFVLQASHFAEFQERGCFLHGGFVFRFAGGLEGLQQGEVLLDGPVDALLVKGEQFKLFRLQGEDVGCGQGCVDLGNIGAGLAAILKLAEGEEVVLDGANAIETPAVGGDALRELDFHGSLGREIFHESLGEFVVGGAVLVSHGGDLTSDAVTERVEAGALLTLFPRSRGQKGIGAVCFELFIGDHGFTRLKASTAGREIAVVEEWELGWERRWRIAGIGDAGVLDLFSLAVTGRRRVSLRHYPS